MTSNSIIITKLELFFFLFSLFGCIIWVYIYFLSCHTITKITLSDSKFQTFLTIWSYIFVWYFIFGSLITSWEIVAARTPDETRALELDRPAAGGIVPQITAANDLFISFDEFDTSSKPPTTPHKKYFHQCGTFPDSSSDLFSLLKKKFFIDFKLTLTTTSLIICFYLNKLKLNI